MKLFFTFLVMIAYIPSSYTQDLPGDLFSVVKIKNDVKSRHVGSYDTTGGNADSWKVKKGEKVNILDVQGAGVITRIWITIAPTHEKLSRNDIVIRMYWDGNSFPSVESPVGPFFGQGWDESYHFISAPLAAAPRDGNALVSYFAMPFAKGARIEIENQANIDIDALYFNIDYSEMKKLPPDLGRFHAWYNYKVTDANPDGENEWGVLGEQGKNKDGKNNYLIADIKGKGQFVGLNYYVNSPSPMWYGEGDEMVFIDGEKLPSINGTGTEDFFNSSWSPKEIYMHPYFGYARVNEGESGWLGRTHCYRFFIDDPVYFDKSCRFTIEHGHNNCLTLELSTVAYWYQSEAVKVPEIVGVNDRKPKPVINVVDMHLWRDAWRKSKGNSPNLWGNEK
jgi:hypothetical protein